MSMKKRPPLLLIKAKLLQKLKQQEGKKKGSWELNRQKVADSPLEALRKACVAVLSENVFRGLESASVKNEKFGSKLVKMVSLGQSKRALVMKKLLRNSNSEYACVIKYHPRLAALSTAKTLSTAFVGICGYVGAKYLDIFANRFGRVAREAEAKLMNEKVKDQIRDMEASLEVFKDKSEKKIAELHVAVKELESENKELKEKNEGLESENKELKEKNEGLDWIGN